MLSNVFGQKSWDLLDFWIRFDPFLNWLSGGQEIKLEMSIGNPRIADVSFCQLSCWHWLSSNKRNVTNITRKTFVEYLSERVENLWRFHFKRGLDLSYLYLMQQDILSWLVNIQDKHNSFCFYNLCYITRHPPGPGPSASRCSSPGWWDSLATHHPGDLTKHSHCDSNVIRSLN